jgi:autotransporter-associated beta strand protein
MRHATKRTAVVWAALAACGAGIFTAEVARAGETWDAGGADDDWLTANNWSPNGAPVNDGTANITFAGAAGLAPNLDANYSINSLFFSPTAGAFVLGSSGNLVLTIGNGGIGHQDNSSQTITHDLTLGGTSTSQTWAAASTGALNVTGDVNTSGKTLILSGGTGAITLAGVISGTGGLTKNSGTQTLDGAGANSYTGVTTVNAGLLQLDKTAVNGAIAGNLVIGDGVGGANSDRVLLLAQNQIGNDSTVTIASSGQLDLNNFFDAIGDLVFTGGGNVDATGMSGLLTVTGGNITTSGTATAATISGTLRLGAATNVSVADGGGAGVDLDITGAVTENVASAMTKNGAGTLRLGGAGTFTGGLRVNAGTVIVNDDAAAGTGTLTLAGGAIKTDVGVTMSNPVVLQAATTSHVTGLFGIEMTGILSGSGNLVVTCDAAGSIPLELGGGSSNTQTGTVTVTLGGLSLDKADGVTALAGTVVVGDGVGAADTASLQHFSHNQIADTSDVTINPDGRWLLDSGSRLETIDNLTLVGGGHVVTGGGTLTVNGNITVNDGGGVSPTVSGNLNLGGGNAIVNVTGSEQFQMQAVVANGSITKTGPGIRAPSRS